jgi:hypothetical protein
VLNYQEELMKYRLDTAKTKLHSAKVLLDAGEFKDSIGRSYYAMFSGVRAILALDNVDFSKHAGVIAYFQKEYIKTGKIAKEYSKYISSAFQIRNNCDYADFFLVSKEDAEDQYKRSVEVVDTIEKFLKNRVKDSESDEV